MASQSISQSPVLGAVTLDDKWNFRRGRVVMNGTQAIARMLLAQAERDAASGFNTAGYVSGYRGSPLGNVDTALWGVSKRLAAANIRFQPGVNEDIAATAMRGTQQVPLLPGARYDGVFAMWYGKGPGVDRSCDALKHGNYAGASARGGVICLFGDDHAGKSSTVAHQSDQAIASCLIPSLYPSDAGEILTYGLLGFALSRFSGAWVGIKCVNETVEQTTTVDVDLEAFKVVVPEQPAPAGQAPNIQSGPFNPLHDEQIALEERLPLVHAFVRANQIDRTLFRSQQPLLGIVSAGKSYRDVEQALLLLGLDHAGAAALGISLYKVGLTWPLEPEGLLAFAAGHPTLLVVEEKRSWIEQQAAELLVNRENRPVLLGKRDEDGRTLFSSTSLLEPAEIALVIAERLARAGDHALTPRRDMLHRKPSAAASAGTALPKRSPYFCSGCPHSRSTRIPEGSLSMTGIGCHTMVNFVRPEEALAPTQMGGEGGNWIGLAPFTEIPHIFQNMGDGTYYHSGLLAIRAAVAAKVNITYKILYNDAVAMTGGQPIDGSISVAEIAHQVRAEGVSRIVIASDDPSRHDPAVMPEGVEIVHRDRLDGLQRELRLVPGASVLIYEQTCAAEKRRRRKRGLFPDPAERLIIASNVCEGCGDCSVQSTCVSLQPVDTDFGTKRTIDQSSCNKDYSCNNGFCPSFITVRGAEPRKPARAAVDPELLASLPVPARTLHEDRATNIMVAGIGGTGVIAVSALLGMAAHIEGLTMSTFDMTGLAQKNGAVYSHLRVARSPDMLGAQRIGCGETDLLLAFDAVAASSEESSSTLRQGTRAVINADISPTVAFQFDRDFKLDPAFLIAAITRSVGKDSVTRVAATRLAMALLGDSVATNLFMVGVAAQLGLLPVGPESVEQAVRLNGVQVEFNLTAFRLGRLHVADPDRLASLGAPATVSLEAPETLDSIVTHRAAHLTAYQNARLAERYRGFVENVRLRAGDALALPVAKAYARLLSYKDEYEVARLLTAPDLHARIAREFADGAKIAFNLAPPILAGRDVAGRPAKREFSARWLPLLRILAGLRHLRGTWFDPFARTHERREERALIAEYEALVERVLEQLRPDNHPLAIGLLGLVDMVRGFGPVKQAALDAYRLKAREAEAAFAESTPPDRSALRFGG